MFLTNACTIKDLSSFVRSDGSSSSHMNPRVSSAACLMSIDSWAAFAAKLGISSNHSFLGISMLAIDAMALPTCFLTDDKGDANTARSAVFTLSLNTASKLSQ